jgi:putative phosphoribosyl transferase
VFHDRSDAGRRLAQACARFRPDRPVVVGLPRGGVPVAAEVAQELAAPLDVVVVRKVGVPFHPELAMGAVGEDGVRVRNETVVDAAGIGRAELEAAEQRALEEVQRRAARFRAGRERVPLRDRTVIVVDDGIATGATARAALRVVRALGAARIVLAVPVGAPATIEALRDDADDVVCLYQPANFFAVGQFYDRFDQVQDDEVIDVLRHGTSPATAAAGDPPRADGEVRIRADRTSLEGHLTIPEPARGVVVFAHGSGSSRHSPRNRQVARALQDRGLGTLLFDLLTPEEAADRTNVFDIELLAGRLLTATNWLRGRPDEHGSKIGYFGASTGAAAALWAAAEPANDVAAVVSRGGRPDLAFDRLRSVRAPTVLIVGGDDRAVLELNRQAAAELRDLGRVEVVPGATHLFEEPGTLETVAELAGGWFVRWLAADGDTATR